MVDLVPAVIIDDPLTICRPSNSSPSGKSSYAPYGESWTHRGAEFVHAKLLQIGKGLVTWPDCQIDKLKNQGRPEKDWFAGVAPVFPLSKLDVKLHDQVMRLNRPPWFPLPAHPPALEADHYVDLRYIVPVRYALLRNRHVALSDDARAAFAFHTFWFQTELQLKADATCSNCGSPVTAEELFERPVRVRAGDGAAAKGEGKGE